MAGTSVRPPSTPLIKYLFGGVLTPSTGTVDMRVPLAADLYAAMRVNVVDWNVPLLFGLDALDAYALYINSVENTLKCDSRDIVTPLVRKNGHIYLEWGHAVHYTTAELERLHRHFNHPAAERLSALLARAGGPKATPNARAELERVAAACQVCQRLAKAPSRYRVALPPDGVTFNRTVYLDLMYLDGRSVLHVVDRDTAFSAAAFTRAEDVETLWQLYNVIWVHPYVGHPSVIHVDQGPQFTSTAWKALAASAGSEVVWSGIEAHNSLGVGERYHAFLRQIYRRVRMEHPSMQPGAALSLSVAAMNSTAGPRGLVPTLLVFGVIPRAPMLPLPLPAQRDRMLAVVTARKEMEAVVAKARVRVAMATPVSAGLQRMLDPGDLVLVYREPPVDQWVGPYTIVSVLNKNVWLAVDGHLKQFSADRVKAYKAPTPPPTDVPTPVLPADHSPPSASAPVAAELAPVPSPSRDALGVSPPVCADAGQIGGQPPNAVGAPDGMAARAAGSQPDYGGSLNPVIAGEALVSSVHTGCRAFVSRLPGQVSMAAPTLASLGDDAADRRTRRCAQTHARPPPLPTDAPNPVRLTEAVLPGDPRVRTTRFREAALKEVGGLRDRGTFTTVREADVPRAANIIGGRFVYTLKQVGTAGECAKARFVAQGHRDKAKWYVVHNLATMRQRSTRLLVSTAANMRWRLFAHDITQAYLQSQDAFSRLLFLRPRPGDRHLFDLRDDELLKLELPLYGVCDAGDYWDATFTDHVAKDLGMVPLTSDPALCSKRLAGGGLSGLLGYYVDDCLMAGDPPFQELTKRTLTRFQAKARTLDDAEFVGVRVTTTKSPSPRLAIDQRTYAVAVKRLPADATFSAFRSSRASVAWLAHTRPDLCCGINLAAQVTEASYGPTAVRNLNALIARAQKGRDVALHYHPLDISGLRIRAYADAAYATNKDGSSQVGYLVLLCDESGRAHILSFSSRKCRRVVHFIMAGEVYAFTAAFDEAFIIRYDLERLYGRHIPINIFTDSKQLFDVVTKGSHPTEKRLMVDVAAARQAYTRHDISNVGLIASNDNMADPLTKAHGCGALNELLRTGVDRTPVVQWVIRPPVHPPCPTTGIRAV